jgi:hypothetical protein
MESSDMDWVAQARQAMGIVESSPDGPDPEGVRYDPESVGDAGVPIRSMDEADGEELRARRAMGQGARQRWKARRFM